MNLSLVQDALKDNNITGVGPNDNIVMYSTRDTLRSS